MARRQRDTRKMAPAHLMELDGDSIVYKPEGGGMFIGTVEEVNALLVATGFHEIAVRINMMSRLRFIEAKETPIYCSPASETYWST